MNVFWTDEAFEDLRLIHEYINRDSRVYASRHIEKILSFEDQIRQFPLAGRLVPEYDDPQIREILTGNYRLIYRIRSDEQIDILAVIHGAREI